MGKTFQASKLSVPQLIGALSVRVEGYSHAVSGLGQYHPETRQVVEETAAIFAELTDAREAEQALQEINRLGGLWEEHKLNKDGTLDPR